MPLGLSVSELNTFFIVQGVNHPLHLLLAVLFGVPAPVFALMRGTTT